MQYNTNSYTAGATYVVTPALVNDFHFNYSFVTGYSTSSVDSYGGAVPVPASQLFPSSISVTGASPVSISNSRIFFTSRRARNGGRASRRRTRPVNTITSTL